jgi:hypothetical protein
MTCHDRILGEFRSANVIAARITPSDSIECLISSPVRSATLILTKPRLLSRHSVSLDSTRSQIEGRWNLITIKESRQRTEATYVLDFYGEDDSLEFALRCDDYRELSEERGQRAPL